MSYRSVKAELEEMAVSHFEHLTHVHMSAAATAVVAADAQPGRASTRCRLKVICSPQKIKIEHPGYQQAVTVAWKQLSGSGNAAAWLQKDGY